MKKPHVILVFYYIGWVYPLRDSGKTHLYCWRRHSKYRFIYINVAFGIPWNLLRHVRIAGVIYHTFFLGARWTPEIFEQKTGLCEALAPLRVPKIAIPQDEFIRTDMLAEFLAKQQVTHLLTCAEEPDWKRIYGRHLDFSRVVVKTVLTGYIDDATMRRVDALKKDEKARRVDIGYRAKRVAYWLGEHGQRKVQVADVIGEAARRRGLNVDISLHAQDTLLGDDWLKFLLGCRATIGVEGGASVLDRDGSIKKAVEAYVNDHPAASFQETRDACFPDRDGEFGLACLSPRHLEACLTETCQILIEGTYNGILRPWEHYIPVRRDYADVEKALDALADPELVSRLVRNAYADVVESGQWTYRALVRECETDILDAAALPEMDLRSWLLCFYFRMRDWLHWRVIQMQIVVEIKKPVKPWPVRMLWKVCRRVAAPAGVT
ncbi:MAG TPA: hypothetical protein VGA17_10535 [Nitrospiraceae bacterium]